MRREDDGERDAQGRLEEGPPRHTMKVEDRRHWARPDQVVEENPEPADATGTGSDESYRDRAEAAERKLQEYGAAFRRLQAEQEEVRRRLDRDLDRRIELKFASLVGQLLATVDDLDLALGHARDIPQAEALAEGIDLARQHFLSALEKQGIERIEPVGEQFDPNLAEAVRVDSVDDPDQEGLVTETVRPGYRLGDHLIRAATVAVGRRPVRD